MNRCDIPIAEATLNLNHKHQNIKLREQKTEIAGPDIVFQALTPQVREHHGQRNEQLVSDFRNNE